MAEDIEMPEVSPGLEAATLVRWLVQPGDLVEAGDVIAEIETDKAVLDIDAPAPGRIGALLVAEGTKAVAVGDPIATLDDAEPASDTPGTADTSRPGGPAPGAAAAVPQADKPARPPKRRPTRTVSFREALRTALIEEMQADDAVFVIGEGVGAAEGSHHVTQGLIERFGAARVVDAPPLIPGLAGLAMGAAFAGLRPVLEVPSFSTALAALDQIVQIAAKTHYMTDGALSVPLVLRGPHGGAGQTGAQHSQDVAGWLAHITGLKVVMPSAAGDAQGLLKAAIRDPGPVIFLENEGLYGQSIDMPGGDDDAVHIGRAKVRRAGKDVTLVSFGIGMIATLEAAQVLARDGIEAEVIDLCTLRPLDTGTLSASVQKTHRCVSVEQGWPGGGIGQQVSAALMRDAFDWLDAPVMTVTGQDVPMPYAASLEAQTLPDAAQIVAAAQSVLYR